MKSTGHFGNCYVCCGCCELFQGLGLWCTCMVETNKNCLGWGLVNCISRHACMLLIFGRIHSFHLLAFTWNLFETFGHHWVKLGLTLADNWVSRSLGLHLVSWEFPYQCLRKNYCLCLWFLQNQISKKEENNLKSEFSNAEYANTLFETSLQMSHKIILGFDEDSARVERSSH